MHQYQFQDESPAPGGNYYRLRMLDVDGSSSRSGTVFLAGEKAGRRLDISPSPVASGLVLRFSDGSVLPEILRVFNALGQPIADWSGCAETECRADVSGWPSGTYFVRAGNEPLAGGGREAIVVGCFVKI